MQTAGNFVGVRIKLAAGVKFSHYDFSGRSFFFLDLVNWNAATVVDNCDRVIEVNCDLDRVAVSG